MNGARIPYWQVLFIVVVVATLMCVGCATKPVAPVSTTGVEMEIHAVCDRHNTMIGVVVAAVSGGVWRIEFDPSTACDDGI